MKIFTERLYQALEKQLYEVSLNANSETEKLKQTIVFCKKAMNILKRYISNYFFENIEDEIFFFKKIKPQFYSKYIYYLSVYKYLIRKPATNCKDIIEVYISKELAELSNFFEQNQAFCLYHRTDAGHLDHIYFTRGASEIYADLEDFQGDEMFSTSHDYRLSKLIANEKYLRFLQLQNGESESGFKTEIHSPVVWTGNQTEMVELVYALAESGALNNGNIEIKTAIEYFQTMFQVDLNHYYHKFRDITNRKKERAVFLEKLKVCLDKKIESKFEL